MRKRYLWSAAAIAVALAWWWDATPGTGGAASSPPAQRSPAVAEAPAAADLPLQRGAVPADSRNLFAAPVRPAPRAPAPVLAVVEAPKAPPLPYKYDGSGVLQGKSFVFLARGGRSFMVSDGDTIDGTYLVEAVGRDRVALRYLPLGIRQVLIYAGGEAPAEVAAAPDKAKALALLVDMPGEAVVGQEFVVTLALPGAGALRATIEVGYDADVLSLTGANLRRPGRAVVEMASGSAPRTQLRFKVLADSPAFTEIDLDVSAATDPSGKRVPVSSPPAYTVSLVLPGA